MATSRLISKPVEVDPPRGATEGSERAGGARPSATLVLEDGTTFEGRAFGRGASTSGEVVFNTGMVGYPESLTDPSYSGQLLVCTYPLIGNYGVPGARDEQGMDALLESWRIHARGLVVADYSEEYSHWDASRSLSDWLASEGVTGLTGIDTRALTKRLREKGSMLGKIVVGGAETAPYDPNTQNLGPLVSIESPRLYAPASSARGRVALVDCGAKHNIVRCMLRRGLEVLRVPWDFDLSHERVNGVVLSNGPGDPTYYDATIANVKKLLEKDVPIFGVCLGNQILSLAIGARTFKLKYGHRGQNQPVIELGTQRCAMTSQNHGFAVDASTLPGGWRPWFENLNDGTNEGIRHESGRFSSVQFHPEAAPGPTDTEALFDRFARMVATR